jgi:hypothetical protein
MNLKRTDMETCGTVSIEETNVHIMNEFSARPYSLLQLQRQEGAKINKWLYVRLAKVDVCKTS